MCWFRFFFQALQLADQLSVPPLQSAGASGIAQQLFMRRDQDATSHRGSRMCDSHGFLFGFGKEHGMIELTHASFQYENSDRGVQDISILVKSGECVVLIGDFSGCDGPP